MSVRSLLRRWFKWLIVFASTIGLAIALAHALNPLQAPSIARSTHERPSVIPLSEPTPLQPQNKYGRQLVHYATVSRTDGSFRQMFVDEATIGSIQPGEPLPDGTLIVMETWYSAENVGTVFVKQKQSGEWQYGSFNPTQPDYQMGFSNSCHSCHAPFPETDFTLTKPLLEAALETQNRQSAVCDRPGRTPCDPETYIPKDLL